MPMEKPKQENQELQKKDSSQIVTPEETSFKPTRKMIKWLETTGELGFTASLTDIGKKSGIRRETWYFWLNNDGFVKWWDDQWQKSLMASRWKLDQIGLKEAKKSYSYWKDMMNRTGNTIPEQGAQVQVNQQFNLPNANMERITR